jgi:transcription-repair coupling factor (superfamily II helicase)
MSILHSLVACQEADDRGLVVVTSARALMQPTLPSQQFRSGTRNLHTSQLLDLEEALRRWTGLGYEPVSVVEEPGQFSHRGGILDIYSPTEPLPVRVELFGNEIESIRSFEPTTQRSEAQLESVTIAPVREPLPRHGPRVAEELGEWFQTSHPAELAEELSNHYEGLQAAAPFPGLEFYLPYFYSQFASLTDYLPADGLLVVDDPADLESAWAELEEQALDLRETAERTGLLPPDYPIPYLTWDRWQEKLVDRPFLTLGHREGESSAEMGIRFRPGGRYGGQLGNLLQDVERALLAGERVVVVSRQSQRLADLWSDDHERVLPVDDVTEPPQAALTFVSGPLDEGWIMQGIDPAAGLPPLRLLTDAEIFGWRMPEPRREIRRRRPAPEALYADLVQGDYVVHVDYGIGIFRGLTTYVLDGEEREYLLVEHAAQDRLFVPVYQADRLARYVGADDRPPQLSRLGTASWSQVKDQARKAVEEVAKELLELYATRETVTGYAFGADTPWQAELEASFPYQETPDQAQAISAVKEDMELPRPMDRLVCGDVGYGKTEVALRAAFKAVMDGKQVAVLVPTTVLAQQHYTTFYHRLAPYPVTVEHLSRFRTRAQQAHILEGLTNGSVDIVIGTHRLLQKDVVFKDIGLIVIDEEQRFGVTHKERLKRMRSEVDVLAMTATPIPRTLYLSLTGVRDISVIETPPDERLPVATYVGGYDPEVVRRAILREMERSGQVFYVHNRVQTIDRVFERVKQLVPEAAMALGHGQMRERDLEQAMLRFAANEVDVLICTSIIESGLDIPNANTLIVEQAERFGLAQLYQLRGRVGRGARRAHAYFFHSPGRIGEDARQRLETIRETTDLGAGYSIAMRDLELRGAGEILGTRQSGHVAVIGFDLYTRLLARAVEEMRAQREGKPPPPEPLSDIHIDLPLPVGLPSEYVPDTNLRLRLYRRLANLGSMDQIGEIESELEDRFGSLPDPTRNLMDQLRFKVMAREARVRRILVEEGDLILYADWVRKAGRGKVQEHMGELAHVGRQTVSFPLEEGWQEQLQLVLEQLRGVA